MDRQDEALIAVVGADPRYQALVRRRSRLGWWLSTLIFGAFVGYTALIAFDKALLARPIGDGVTTLGIPVGIGLILLGIALTAIYVRISNRVYDAEMAAILKDVGA